MTSTQARLPLATMLALAVCSCAAQAQVPAVRGQNCAAYTKIAPRARSREYTVDVASGSDSNHGSAAHPFKTVQKAAGLAKAGDVVTIRAGTYTGLVYVKNSGATGSPIVFQADQCGQAIFTGNTGIYPQAFASWGNNVCLPKFPVQHDVTLSGLTFKNTNNGPVGKYSAVLFATDNWRINDVLIDGAADLEVNVRGSGVIIEQSTFMHGTSHSLVGCGGNTIVRNVINAYNVSAAAAKACGNSCSIKFLFTDHMLVDNIESYGNNGPGWWFDAKNKNFTVQNSYFHNNTGIGLFDEISDGPGLIQGNTFDHNEMDLGIAESQNVTVINNVFNGGSRVPFEFRTMTNRCQVSSGGTCTKYYWLKNLTIHNNKVKAWTHVLIHNGAVSNNPRWASPPFQTLNIQMDYNTYWPTTSSLWILWQDEPSIKSFNAFQSTLGVEAHGSQTPF
jgi:nitrous oxidase accessory protein NosD